MPQHLTHTSKVAVPSELVLLWFQEFAVSWGSCCCATQNAKLLFPQRLAQKTKNITKHSFAKSAEINLRLVYPLNSSFFCVLPLTNSCQEMSGFEDKPAHQLDFCTEPEFWSGEVTFHRFRTVSPFLRSCIG